MSTATSTTIKFSSSKAENEKMVLAGVAAACKALAKGQNTLKFEGAEIVCAQNNVHDLKLNDAGKQAVFNLQFVSTQGVCLLSVRPSNATFHPEQKGHFWAKFQAPKREAVLLGVFNAKGVKVAESVKFVPAPDATPFVAKAETVAP